MAENVVKLLFAGDFCCSEPQQLQIGSRLKNLINQSDICELNFEGVIPHGVQESPLKFYLDQNIESPDWCVKNGFNVVSFANNHTFDFGEDGIRYTIQQFADRTTILGVGTWNEAYEVKFVDCKGRRIGFFALSSGDLSSLKSQYDDGHIMGCAWLGHSSIWRILQEARKKCDYLFVLPHAGVEYMSVPLPEWRELYKSFIDFGCDGVIASHPHVPQGWEMYKAKPILYSLGNFAFEKNRPMPYLWYRGLVASITCDENEISLNVYPTLYGNHQIEIDSSKEAKERSAELCAKLNDDIYLEYVNKEVEQLSPKYESWLLSGFSALKSKPFSLKKCIRFVLGIKPNHRVALHQLREESTRYTLTRHLKNESKTKL